MRVIVLGNTGYIGGHTAGRLRATDGVRVVTAGRSPQADLPVDLATVSAEALADVLRPVRPDAVVNCAGATGGDAVRLAEANARGPAVLCAALRAAAPAARLVHLGSAAEYGPAAPGRPVDESAATCPSGPYGATKLAGTAAVTASGLDAVVLRVFNPVGPGAPAGSLPGALAEKIREAHPDGTVRVGDLSAYRDFVDVRDVAEAAVLAALARHPLPPVLNIGAGTAVRARTLAAELARVAGFRGRIEESGGGSARSSAVSWQQADTAAAAGALGWRARTPLPVSLAGLWAARVPAAL